MRKTTKKIIKRPRRAKAESVNESENVSYETFEKSLKNQDGADADIAGEPPLINDEPEPDSANINLGDLTIAELVQLARPYSNRAESTLMRLKREHLIWIIHNQRDDFEKTELSNLNRDSKDLIEIIISILNDIKEARGAGSVNALLLRILRNQGNRISEGFIKVGISGGMFGWIMCGFVFSLCIIDSVWGLQAISKIFKKGDKPATDEKK